MHFLICLWLLSFSLQAIEQQLQLNVTAGAVKAANSPFFNPQDTSVAQASLSWQLQHHNWETQLVALHEQHSRGETKSQFIISELFWQGELNQWDSLIGKRRLDFSVSYAYKPLDLFIHYPANPIGIQIEEGVGTVTVSQFTQAGELSLFYTDAHLYQQKPQSHQPLKRGIGARWYQMANMDEWQTLLYWDDQHGINIGASFVTTSGETWEFHTEALYQQDYQNWQLTQPMQYPVTQSQHTNGVTLLTGLTWANYSGHNLTLEYWYDNRAWRYSTWQNLLKASAIKPLSLAMGQVFQTQNLLQHQLMLHWHLDNWELANRELAPALDLMLSPEDGGIIITTGVDYPLRQTLNIGTQLRYFSDHNSSVYSQLPNQLIWVLNMELFF